MTKLSYLNEPGVLHNLKERYQMDGIYTYTSNILIAVNPFFPVPQLYGQFMMEQYKGRVLGELSPHVYAIAENAYQKMLDQERSQSVLISGESGAGKTETSKILMNYLAFIGGHAENLQVGEGEKTVEQQVLQSNPILETFGNAKSVRNDNSSRFGKYMEIQFDGQKRISGAAIRTYLLERSRVVSITDPERAYHSFYQLCYGADAEERARLHLKPAAEFHYLNQSTCFELDGVDNAESYRQTRAAMTVVGMSQAEQDDAFRCVAAVLHLGNIAFEETEDEGSRVGAAAEEHLAAFADIMGVDQGALAKALTTRTRKTFDGAISSPLLPPAAKAGRDSLAKNLYSKLFDWIVATINTSIGQDAGSKLMIGVLDIYGFEQFKQNDFEQFCINLANEKLQQHFNQHVFKMEQELYKKEQIDWSYIEFVDNQDILDMIEKKPGGVIDLIDEKCQFPQSKAEDLAEQLGQTFKGHARFEKPKLDRLAFALNHYAGKVTYQTTNFLDKNKDYVVEAHMKCLTASSSPFIVELFREKEPAAGAGGRKTKSSFKFSSVAGNFKVQLGKLMTALNATEPHYIRCIKPNMQSKPGLFEDTNVLHQLRCGGVLEAIRIACAGFPSRLPFEEFVDRFGLLKPLLLDGQMDDREICKHLVEDAGLELYQIGLTRIFLKGGAMAVMDKRRQEKLNASAILIQKRIRGFLARRRFLRVRAAVVRIQAHARGMAARKRYRFLRETKAATKLQTAYRSSVAWRQYQRTRNAAVRLQARARGRAARRKYKNIKKELAATTIQSTWRGTGARREFRRFKAAAVTFQCAWRCKGARKELRRLKVEARSSAGLLKDKRALENKKKALEENVANLQNQKAELRAQVKALKAAQAESGAKIAELTGRLEEAAAVGAALEEERARAQDLEARVAEATAALALAAQGGEEKDARIAALEEDVVKARAEGERSAAASQEVLDLKAVLEAAQAEVAAKAKELEAAMNSRKDLELNRAMLQHRVTELEQIVRTPPRSARSARRHANGDAGDHSIDRLKAASQASLASVRENEIQKETDVKKLRAMQEQAAAEQEKLIRCVAEEVGFHDGKPVAASIIFRSLLHWQAFSAERTNVFDRIITTMGSILDKQQENNEVLSYWLSNTVTLLSLFRRYIKPPSDSGMGSRKRVNSITMGASLFGGFGRSGSIFGRASPLAPQGDNANLELTETEQKLIEAKYPALLFKQQLDAFVQKIFSLIRDNVKRDIAVPIHNCIHAPRQPRGDGRRRGTSVSAQNNAAHWNPILGVMDKLLVTLKANHVPPFLVRKVFSQIFAFVNVQLFNQLLLRRECCSFSNGEYVKMGLTELESWIIAAGDEWVGKSAEELLQIRQAVGFLVIHQKPKKSLHEITMDLCPVLSVQQLYRISTMYWDDKYGTETVSGEVLAQMKQQMVEDTNSNSANTSFLLDDDPSVPFGFDDIAMDCSELDIYSSEIPIPPTLRESDAFAFLTIGVGAAPATMI